MTRQISRAEAWEKVHTAFEQINFNSFDYNAIKESLLDYVKLYFPEDFNDYIESSEFIALLELFAYVGELLAYRVDMNAHENFITTAQRKESVLRLAQLISYKVTRNIPARGLVKLTSIRTSENVVDSNGRNLGGRQIIWNDPNNPNWKEQFLLVLNRVLEQEFGTISPNERVQVDDVLFELYTLNNNPLQTNGRSVIPYNATVSGSARPMELVPINLTDNGPEERRPENNAKMSLVYADDGLGDGSNTTGFMLFTKQGTLASQRSSFDGVTPNQTFTIAKNDINDTDVWVNTIDPDTGQIVEQNPVEGLFPHLVSESMKFGEWVEVDTTGTQNIAFNTIDKRQKYQVETLDDDNIRIVFGDGEFADIPSGVLEFWYRRSANEDLVIPRNAIIDQPNSISYNDINGTTQTLSFTFSLTGSLQNNSASETIDHIKRVAPSVYYSQNRMVNGRDYNTFMLQNPSIVKMRTINRTFAGDSKYIAWFDPSQRYDNVKIFGDDLALYWEENSPEDGNNTRVNTGISPDRLLDNVIEPLLSSTDFFSVIGDAKDRLGLNATQILRRFTDQTYSFDDSLQERQALLDSLSDAAGKVTSSVDIYYGFKEGEFEEWISGDLVFAEEHPSGEGADIFIRMLNVVPLFDGNSHSGWEVNWRTRRMVAQSEETQFWNSNDASRVINFDTLNSVEDSIVVLKANTNANETGVLSKNYTFKVLGQQFNQQQPTLPNGGLPDVHKLSVLPEDTNSDGIADNLQQQDLFDRVFEGTWPIKEIDGTSQGQSNTTIDIGKVGERYNNDPEKGLDNDVEIYVDEERFLFQDKIFIGGSEPTKPLQTKIDTNTSLDGKDVKVIIKDYVYFARPTATSSWVPKPDTDGIRTKFLSEDVEQEQDRLYRRLPGRFPLNFGWFHFTPRQHLIDPAPSNIHDMFIMTRGYYTALQRFIQGRTDIEPSEPSPLELRLAYSDLIDNKMLSDTVILHSGRFKIMFGSKAPTPLKARFKIIRPTTTSLTDNQVKVRIADIVRRFFNIEQWEFGETFYFSELAAFIHFELGVEIDSVLLVPTSTDNQFGDMFQVKAREDEMFMPDINPTDIDVVRSFTPENLRIV